ncbi:hypothetical protein BOX15_Mlig012416g1, partial [Macrostomum lignano]
PGHSEAGDAERIRRAAVAGNLAALRRLTGGRLEALRQATDSHGNSLLHCSGHLDVIDYLLDCGLPPTAVNCFGDRPIDLARRKGLPDEVLDRLNKATAAVDDSAGVSGGSEWRRFGATLGPVRLVFLAALLLLLSGLTAFLLTNSSESLTQLEDQGDFADELLPFDADVDYL